MISDISKFQEKVVQIAKEFDYDTFDRDEFQRKLDESGLDCKEIYEEKKIDVILSGITFTFKYIKNQKEEE